MRKNKCNRATSTAYVESLAVSPDVIVDDEDERGTMIGNIVDWKKARDGSST